MLEKVRATDKPNKNDAAKLQSKVEKDLLTYSELMVGQKSGTQGVLAYRRPAKGMQAIAAAEAERPRPDPALANRGIADGVRGLAAAERARLRAAAEAARRARQGRNGESLAERLAEIQRRRTLTADAPEIAGHAPSPAPHLPLAQLRITALMKEHALLTPKAFESRGATGHRSPARRHSARARRVGGRPRQPRRNSCAGTAIGDRRSRSCRRSVPARRRASARATTPVPFRPNARSSRSISAIRSAPPRASTPAPKSPVISTSRSRARMRRRDAKKAEDYLLAHSGPAWRTMWNITFFTDGTNLTRYADYAHLVSKEDRAATQLRLTNLTEQYAFTRMLNAAQKSGRKDIEQFVEKLAASLGHDLSVARADSARLAPANALARRTGPRGGHRQGRASARRRSERSSGLAATAVRARRASVRADDGGELSDQRRQFRPRCQPGAVAGRRGAGTRGVPGVPDACADVRRTPGRGVQPPDLHAAEICRADGRFARGGGSCQRRGSRSRPDCDARVSRRPLRQQQGRPSACRPMRRTASRTSSVIWRRSRKRSSLRRPS